MIEDISIDYKIDDYTISKKTDIETMKVYPNIFSGSQADHASFKFIN